MMLTRREAAAAAAAAKRGDWAWFGEDLLAEVVAHAEPQALPILARLDRRTRQASAERLGRLAVLRRKPFSLPRNTVLGLDGANRSVSREIRMHVLALLNHRTVVRWFGDRARYACMCSLC